MYRLLLQDRALAISRWASNVRVGGQRRQQQVALVVWGNQLPSSILSAWLDTRPSASEYACPCRRHG
jgi:hypothetical protein